MDRSAVLEAIPFALAETSLPELGLFRKGKVRDCYLAGDRRYLVATDRVSVFDHVLADPVPYKGQVLTAVAKHFLEEAEEVVPTAYLESPHPNVMVLRECDVIPFEVIVRGYLAGSAWRHYEAGGRSLCGVALPEDLERCQRLPEPILTPTTKADTGHDAPVTREEILASGLVETDVWKTIEEASLELYARGAESARKRGLILVDTKYEFGLHEGRVVLVDEVHTPDSSRYWLEEEYERSPRGPRELSKEFIRERVRNQGFTGQEGMVPPRLSREVLAEASLRYIELHDRVTGQTFVPREGDMHADIHQALVSSGHLTGQVAVVLLGSRSDRRVAAKVSEALRELGISHVTRIVSGHRDPERLLDLVRWTDRSPGEVVYVDVTGLSNAKGPLVSANTANLVFHLANPTSPDLLSSLNLPSGVPMALVAGEANLALVVAKHLSARRPCLRERLLEVIRRRRDAARADDDEMGSVWVPGTPLPGREGASR